MFVLWIAIKFKIEFLNSTEDFEYTEDTEYELFEEESLVLSLSEELIKRNVFVMIENVDHKIFSWYFLVVCYKISHNVSVNVTLKPP